jgi:hypothetical protein
MNSVRMMVFTGVLGALGFGTIPAQAQSVRPVPIRRVSYAPSGGYHDNAAPQPAPIYTNRSVDPAPVRFQTPSWATTTRHSVGSSYDPSGRHDGLARPWLR